MNIYHYNLRFNNAAKGIEMRLFFDFFSKKAGMKSPPPEGFAQKYIL
jgi:hypothetical protein